MHAAGWRSLTNLVRILYQEREGKIKLEEIVCGKEREGWEERYLGTIGKGEKQTFPNIRTKFSVSQPPGGK